MAANVAGSDRETPVITQTFLQHSRYQNRAKPNSGSLNLSFLAGTIYDGILARRFGVATPALRRYDSVTDVIYYLFILAAAFRLCQPVVTQNWPLIALILLSEAGTILTSYVRFGKYPATHSYLAKFYGLCLLAALIALLVFNAGSWVIIALTVVALLTNLEIIAIHFVMNTPPVDVRSIFALPKR